MAPTALVVRQLSAQASSEPQTFTSAFTVGRSPECQVQIVHPLVSRAHLLLSPTPSGWHVTCQGRNGMLVNGMVTREAIVTQGTRIQLGDASGPALGLTPIATATPGVPLAPGAHPGQPMPPVQYLHPTHPAQPAQPPHYAVPGAPVPGTTAPSAPMAPSAPPAASSGAAPGPVPGPMSHQSPSTGPQAAPGAAGLTPRPAPLGPQPTAPPAAASGPTAPPRGASPGAPGASPALSPDSSAATFVAPSAPSSPVPGEAGAQSTPRTILHSFRFTSPGTIGRAPDN